jgi:hypothetical protein
MDRSGLQDKRREEPENQAQRFDNKKSRPLARAALSN